MTTEGISGKPSLPEFSPEGAEIIIMLGDDPQSSISPELRDAIQQRKFQISGDNGPDIRTRPGH